MTSSDLPVDWETYLKTTLALFGHRNWVVVADAAYPAQATPGINTIAVNGDHIEVVNKVLSMISASTHLRAKVYTDLEFEFVTEDWVAGVSNYKRQFASIIGDTVVHKLKHEEIIAKLDQCAQLFRVLIVKTSLTIPYTSVFIELDCGYWGSEAEEHLWQAMQLDRQ